MGSGQGYSLDWGATAPQGEPSGASYDWNEEVRQQLKAAQPEIGRSPGGGGGTSGNSNASDTFWYMRSDSQSSTLNYFIPIGVLLGLVTLACLLVGFWWRRRLERQRRHQASQQPADLEQGRQPRCSLDLEAAYPPHLPRIPVLIVCPDNKPAFGWQLEDCQLSSVHSTPSMHSEGSGSCASTSSCSACCKGGTNSGGGGGGYGGCSGCCSPTCASSSAGEAGPSRASSAHCVEAGAFSPAPSLPGGEAEQPSIVASQRLQQHTVAGSEAAGAAAAAGIEAPAAAAVTGTDAPAAAAAPVVGQQAGEGPAGQAGSPSDPLSALLAPHLAAALAAMPVAVVPVVQRSSSRRQADDEVWPPRPQPRRVTVDRLPATAAPRQRRPPIYTIEFAAPIGDSGDSPGIQMDPPGIQRGLPAGASLGTAPAPTGEAASSAGGGNAAAAARIQA